MNPDEERFNNDARKFSVVQECPKCGQLGLSYRKGNIICTSCGYTENVPALR